MTDKAAKAQSFAEEVEAEAAAPVGSPLVKWVGGGLCAMLTMGALLWAADLYRAFGLVFMNEQFYAAMLAIGLAGLYIVVPVRKGMPRTSVPWHDMIAAAVSGAAALYVMVVYPTILDNFADNPVDAVVAAGILLAAIVEGLRRTAGNVLFAFLLFFLVFALVGHLIPGRLQGEDVPIDRLAIYVVLDANGMFGFPMKVSTTIVIAFMFFGFLLEPAGGARFFTDVSAGLMGRYRGGSSKIAIVGSSLFGSISGSAVSNVVSTGVITIPLMQKGGYPKHSAAAIEAVASTGGQLMPPMMGVAAFVMAELLQIGYAEVVIAALIPAILYYVALFIQVDLQAARDGILPIDKSTIPSVLPVLGRGGIFVVPFVVIILCLFRWAMQPETAALYAALTLVPIGFLLGYGGDRLTIGSLVASFVKTGKAGLELLMIGGAAGAIIGVLNISALGFALTSELVGIAGGSLVILLILAAIVCIILGMGMPTLGVYILLATLVAPAIIELGVPDLSAHLFVMYFGMMSMITPPVAIAAFAAATLAGAPMMKTGWQAVKYGWSAYLIPFVFIMSPTLLLQGSAMSVGLSITTALFGVFLVSIAVIGFLLAPVAGPLRISYAIAGLALIIPIDAFSAAPWVNLIGGAVGAVLVATEVIRRRTRTAVAASAGE
ncbi:MAG: TRAP transporter fused permease subunit [Rhodospirillaceae bacterium]|nr:TRAP transporter fused permease subunit [Rhodospirillaceae bacterium]